MVAGTRQMHSRRKICRGVLAASTALAAVVACRQAFGGASGSHRSSLSFTAATAARATSLAGRPAGRASSSRVTRNVLDFSSLFDDRKDFSSLNVASLVETTEDVLSSVNVAELVETTEDVLVSVVGWTVVIISAAIIKVAVTEEKGNTPKSFLQGADDRQASPPVVCVGDSLTRGNLSADWVSDLREMRVQQMPVLNAGVNMECAQNIRNRLDEIIACRPSHVSVLVGTNDMKAGMSAMEGELYKRLGQLSEAPTLESYERDLVEIRQRLTDAGACVALVSPPVLGENLASEANKKAAEFADVVRRVAAEGGERCAYLPLFEVTAADLPESGGRPYCGASFFGLLCSMCVDVHLRQRTLDDLQRERDLGVTVDLVHLGPDHGRRLAQMVSDFVENVKPAPLPRLELPLLSPACANEVEVVFACSTAEPQALELPLLSVATTFERAVTPLGAFEIKEGAFERAVTG